MTVGKAHALALAVLSSVAFVPAAHGTVRAPKTTAPDVFVSIQVKITDTRIILDRHTANRGDVGRFIIRNVGKQPHTFTLGTTHRTGAIQTGFARRLEPGKYALAIMFLAYRGSLAYRSTLPADRGKQGMKGTFKIL